jgi:hypothetical protein
LLRIPPTVAVTSAFPVRWAGTTTAQLVIEVQSTLAAGVDPNSKLVAVVPRPNPLPVTVTLLPPALDPVLGLRLAIVGGPTLKLSFDEAALVPFGVATVTSSVPAVCAGETAVMEFEELTVKLAA